MTHLLSLKSAWLLINKMMKFSFIGLTLFIISLGVEAQELYKVPANVHTRWASAENVRGLKGEGAKANKGRKGSPQFKLRAGDEQILAEINGQPGVVRRIWMTIYDQTPEMLTGLRIQMYWDQSLSPAVDVPLGDFFGFGLGRTFPFESYLFSSPEGRSFNCSIPMPFRQSMLIKIINETDKDQNMVFYDIDYTIGDSITEEDLYFHAYYNQQRPTELRSDYEFLPKIVGKGCFLGVSMNVVVDTVKYASSWWGEGEVKFYIDGDGGFPTLAGTGTEDYIGTAWELGSYANLGQGCPIADHKNREYSFYRYHVKDPIYFHEDIRGTIQQIGFCKGEKVKELGQTGTMIYATGESAIPVDFSEERNWLMFERSDDYSSCAFFYLNSTSNSLPPLPGFEQRKR